MSDMLETEVELKAEDLDKYIEATAGVVEELRHFLALHHADLVHCAIRLHGTGGRMTMPEAYKDPQYAGRVHNLKQAWDSFLNAMRGVY
jgi:hypothetical protein